MVQLFLQFDDGGYILLGMKYLDRLLGNRLRQLASTFPAVVVVGARQVGKSTLITHTFGSSADYVVFDPVIDVENARRDPELFLDNHPARPLLLDEIQYAPQLVPVLKRRIDRDARPGSFVLTGSQQWEVMRALAESLAGRAVFLDLEGFCFAEVAGIERAGNWLESWLDDPQRFIASHPRPLAADVPLYEWLWRGTLPQARILPLETIPDFHAGYLRTYVERDVRLLADVSDWQLFARFVRLAAALTAHEINASQLGRDIGVTPQTATRWLDMMRATFQWFDLPAFSGNQVKRVSRKAKGHIADTGFACAALAISSHRALASHPALGDLFETAICAEIRKLAAAIPTPPRFHHWRSAGGAEVDLLLERDGRFFPLEIKVKSRPSRGDTRGISAFRKTYPRLDVQPGLVIAPAEKMVRISEHDYAMPWTTASPQHPG
jgi:uncharacterized protein